VDITILEHIGDVNYAIYIEHNDEADDNDKHDTTLQLVDEEKIK
jgi:hypothetical protein